VRVRLDRLLAESVALSEAFQAQVVIILVTGIVAPFRLVGAGPTWVLAGIHPVWGLRGAPPTWRLDGAGRMWELVGRGRTWELAGLE
jgi:hypothetical protein